MFSSQVSAVTFAVNSAVDAVDVDPGDGKCETSTASVCTLRAAIQESNALTGSDIIELPADTYTFGIAGRGEDLAASGDLDITDNLSIIGDHATTTIVDADEIDRIFDIFSTANVTVSKLTIKNGDSGYPSNGGGVRNQGVLTLTKANLFGNTAGLAGGGIFDTGTLSLMDSTVSNNSAGRSGGIINWGNITLINVTISSNTASSDAAGMDNSTGGTAFLTNVTISGNVGGGSTTSVGGFSNRGSAILTNVTVTNNSGLGIALLVTGSFSPSTILKNTIVANNLVGGDCYAPRPRIVSLGYNLDSDDTCGLTSSGDIVNTDPLLSPLQDHGGFTLTHALLPGSPAIDAGSPDCPPPLEDQRSEPRPVDGNGDGQAACDIGSYEAQPSLTIIGIDAKPGSQPNSINPRSLGLVAVAILTSDEFDALLIDPDTVRFGPAGAPRVHTQPHVEDVDYDGDMDLLFHFRTQETGIQCGDTEATLTGETWDGASVSGTDSVNPAGCR